ncbi:hypothetical protein L9F63_003074, partial [Diploptera punctata]
VVQETLSDGLLVSLVTFCSILVPKLIKSRLYYHFDQFRGVYPALCNFLRLLGALVFLVQHILVDSFYFPFVIPPVSPLSLFVLHTLTIHLFSLLASLYLFSSSSLNVSFN